MQKIQELSEQITKTLTFVKSLLDKDEIKLNENKKEEGSEYKLLKNIKHTLKQCMPSQVEFSEIQSKIETLGKLFNQWTNKAKQLEDSQADIYYVAGEIIQKLSEALNKLIPDIKSFYNVETLKKYEDAKKKKLDTFSSVKKFVSDCVKQVINDIKQCSSDQKADLELLKSGLKELDQMVLKKGEAAISEIKEDEAKDFNKKLKALMKKVIRSEDWINLKVLQSLFTPKKSVEQQKGQEQSNEQVVVVKESKEEMLLPPANVVTEELPTPERRESSKPEVVLERETASVNSSVQSSESSSSSNVVLPRELEGQSSLQPQDEQQLPLPAYDELFSSVIKTPPVKTANANDIWKQRAEGSPKTQDDMLIGMIGNFEECKTFEDHLRLQITLQKLTEECYRALPENNKKLPEDFLSKVSEISKIFDAVEAEMKQFDERLNRVTIPVHWDEQKIQQEFKKIIDKFMESGKKLNPPITKEQLEKYGSKVQVELEGGFEVMHITTAQEFEKFFEFLGTLQSKVGEIPLQALQELELSEKITRLKKGYHFYSKEGIKQRDEEVLKKGADEVYLGFTDNKRKTTKIMAPLPLEWRETLRTLSSALAEPMEKITPLLEELSKMVQYPAADEKKEFWSSWSAFKKELNKKAYGDLATQCKENFEKICELKGDSKRRARFMVRFLFNYMGFHALLCLEKLCVDQINNLPVMTARRAVIFLLITQGIEKVSKIDEAYELSSVYQCLKKVDEASKAEYLLFPSTFSTAKAFIEALLVGAFEEAKKVILHSSLAAQKKEQHPGETKEGKYNKNQQIRFIK